MNKINKALMFSYIMLFFFCRKKKQIKPKASDSTKPVQPVDNVWYAAFFYLTNFGDSMFSKNNILLVIIILNYTLLQVIY